MEGVQTDDEELVFEEGGQFVEFGALAAAHVAGEEQFDRLAGQSQPLQVNEHRLQGLCGRSM